LRPTVALARRSTTPSGEHRPHRRCDRVGLSLDPTLGEPENTVAGELQGCVPCPIMLERAAGAMELVSIELDDEARLGPDGVDLEATDHVIDERRGQTVLATEIDELSLELGAGEGSRESLRLDGRCEGTDAAASITPRADVIDRPKVEQPQALGLPHRSLELMTGNDLGDVEQCPGDGGDRDPGASGPILVE
jgi:hypothetical protein